MLLPPNTILPVATVTSVESTLNLSEPPVSILITSSEPADIFVSASESRIKSVAFKSKPELVVKNSTGCTPT